MLEFFNNTFLGVRFFIWLYFMIGVVALGSGLIYWYRETIRRKYYELRFPEKIIKVVIHYKTGIFREYFRLIPDDYTINVDGKSYNYNDKAILKIEEILKEENKGLYAIIDGKKYPVIKENIIKKRRSNHPEIHFFYNVTTPINYDFEKLNAEFSAKEQQDFKENDLFQKLLTLEDEKKLLKFILIVTIITLLGVGFIVAKLMEWI